MGNEKNGRYAFSIENDYKNYMAEIKKEKTINSQQKYI